MWEYVILEKKENGVAVLTLNRPQHMNAFNEQLCLDIVDAARVISQDNDIKVLILTGAGAGFCSGGDIGVLAAMDSPAKAKWTYDISTSVVRAVYELEKPVIAAVNGAVAGAAIAMMMACDLVIASEEAAKIRFSFINIAFGPDSGCSHFLVNKVGYHKAAEILMFGKNIKAAEAEQLGLVNKVVPHETLLDEAMTWAQKLASSPTYTLWLDKKLLRATLKNDFYEQAELESMYQVLACHSEDFREGVTAFVEKRKPYFKGK